MKVILPLLLFTASQTVLAQKVDLDKYSFTAAYRDLPRMGLDTSYKTFSIETELSQNAAFMLKQEQPAERVNIAGWRKLPSRAHLRVNVRMQDIVIENSDVKERVQILKDRNGKETGRRYFYYTELIYTFDGLMTVTDFRGRAIMDRYLCSRNEHKVYRTKEYNSQPEALTAFVSNVLAVTTAITSAEVNRTMAEVNDILNTNLGYPLRTVGDYLWILDSKRHPEYRAHKQAFTAFKQAMFQMRADQPLDQVRERLQPVIKYFEKMIDRYDSDSKGDRKMRYASYYNLAKIYYYLDDPEASLFEAGQLMINDYDESDGRGLESAAADLKYLLELNQRPSRHFPIDVERLEGPTPSTASSGY